MHLSAVASAFPELEFPMTHTDPSDNSVEEIMRVEEDNSQFNMTWPEGEVILYPPMEEDEPVSPPPGEEPVIKRKDVPRAKHRMDRINELKEKFLKSFEEKLLGELDESDAGVKKLENLAKKLEKKGVEDVLAAAGVTDPSLKKAAAGMKKQTKKAGVTASSLKTQIKKEGVTPSSSKKRAKKPGVTASSLKKQAKKPGVTASSLKKQAKNASGRKLAEVLAGLTAASLKKQARKKGPAGKKRKQ